MSDKNQKDSRTRNWTIVVYPESLPANWRDIIDEWHIEWVESPLHDKDINADGSPKKPHYHLLLMFGGVKTYEQVLELIQPLNCPIPTRCHNAKSLIRYMAHLDNPDKHQYDISKIVSHGGVDVMDLLKPSSAERYTYLKEMQDWCRDNNVVEFEDLMNYASEKRFDDWFPLLCDSCAFVMTKYLSSRRHRNQVRIDPETGEVLS